jgi:hypothetical protein
MATIRDQEQFEKVVSALKAGEFDDDPAIKAEVLLAAEAFKTRGTIQPPLPRAEEPPIQLPPGVAGPVAGLEALIGFASQAPAAIIGGGTAGLAASQGESLGMQSHFLDTAVRRFTFEPRTALGRQILGDLQKPFEDVHEAAGEVSRLAADPFGSGEEIPFVAPVVQTLLEGIPAVLGGVRGRAPVGSRSAARGRPIPNLSPVQELARQGNELGFVFNPKDVKGGLVSAVEGIAGAPKLNAALSNKNMRPTTQLINEQLGIKSNPKSPTQLQRKALEIKVGKLGESYKPISEFTERTGSRFHADQAYMQQYNALVQKFNTLVEEAPGFAPSKALQKRLESLNPQTGNINWSGSTADLIIKQLREQANASFKKGKSIEGFAFRDLSDVFQDMINRNFEGRGEVGVVANMQLARKRIAETYSVLDALGKRGAIDASKLVAQRAAGRPLTGNLSKIADLAEAFPEQMRNVSAPPAFSEFEGLAGVTGAAAGASLSPAALVVPSFIAAKPVVRGAIGTQFGQRLNFPGPSHPGILPGLIAAGALQQQGLLEPPSVFNQ